MSKDESAIGGVLSRFLGARVLRYPFVSLRGTQLGSGRHGRLPERPMGADCKSVAKATKVRILHLPLAGPRPGTGPPPRVGVRSFLPEILRWSGHGAGDPAEPTRRWLTTWRL